MTNKDYNKNYDGFQINVFQNGFYDVHKKSNGSRIYSSYGRAVKALDQLVWGGKFERWQLEVVAVNKATGELEKLGY